MNLEARGTRQTRRKQRANLYAADCPSRGVLDHIATRWSSLILVMLLEKTHRFSELARRIGGVSERMLAHSLHALEADGFVLRVVYPTKPPKVEYSLTPLGCELRRPCSGTHPMGGGERLTCARPSQSIGAQSRAARACCCYLAFVRDIRGVGKRRSSQQDRNITSR